MLNADELRLCHWLLGAGLLQAAALDRLSGVPVRVLASFGAEQADDSATLQDESVDAQRQESVLRHEVSHGRYFTDGPYREHCQRFWCERLSENERLVRRRCLDRLGYDPANEDLMANQTQVLLMHTPDARDVDAAAGGHRRAGARGAASGRSSPERLSRKPIQAVGLARPFVQPFCPQNDAITPRTRPCVVLCARMLCEANTAGGVVVEYVCVPMELMSTTWMR